MNTVELKKIESQINTAIENGELLNAYQVAAMLGIHHNNVLKACKDGKIECAMFGSKRGTYLMTPEAVATWRDGMKFWRAPTA